MASIKITDHQQVFLRDKEYRVDYEVDAEMHYRPAILGSSVDNSVPDESECSLSINIVSVTNAMGIELPQPDNKALWDHLARLLDESTITDKCWKEYHS
jgi:hypothetical protein